MNLTYYKTFLQSFHWFLLYEFTIDDVNFFEKDIHSIIEKLINSKFLNKELYHQEMDNEKLEVSAEGLKSIGRPYNFNKITISDFRFFKDIQEFKNWVSLFKNQNWEGDEENISILMKNIEEQLLKRTNLKNGIWLLSKENCEENKLIDIHWIYPYFETFIEIDKENQVVRTLDIAND